jgi:ribonuclease BN (tRNA processing enzyme)
MKLTFLGSGSAFIVGKDNYQSNLLIENEKGQRLLIDCGSDARQSLYEIGFTHTDIDAIYISHLHSDHTGGLEWLAFSCKFDQNAKKPKLYISSHLVHELWEQVLKGGLASLEGKIPELSTFFDVHPIDNNSSFIWSGIEFKLLQTIHVMSGYCLEPSYGLLFNIEGTEVFFTGDSQLTPYQILNFYKMSDLIFQDCEISQNPSHVHAHFNELKALPSEIKSKMWLYHYGSEPLPDSKKEGFRGFVKKGQCFSFSDPQSLL